MTQPRYPIIISLSGKDKATLDELKKKNIKIVDIFRKGMETLRGTHESTIVHSVNG